MVDREAHEGEVHERLVDLGLVDDGLADDGLADDGLADDGLADDGRVHERPPDEGRIEDHGVDGGLAGEDLPWIEAASDTEDPAADGGPELHSGLPPKLETWRRRSAIGAILTGIGMGFREAFEPKRTEPSIVLETSGKPPSDLPVEAELEQMRPRQSVVKIRPWLLTGKPSEARGEAAVEDLSDRSGTGRE